MKMLYGVIRCYTIFLISLVFFACSDNPVENTDCPQFTNEIAIVSHSPYGNPIWHPNGNYIGFNYTPLDSITYPYGTNCYGKQHFNYDFTGFWLVNIDGTNKRRILPYQLSWAQWSLDGKWVVFNIGAQIYKMPFNVADEKFDTTQIQQLTFEGRNFFPAWSPDGEWITYDSNNDSPNGMNFIWKMKADGTQKIRIAYDPESGEIRMPSWSPDNKYIVHQRYVGVGAPEIVIMEVNGENPIRLTFDTNDDSFPKYSPDGSQLAFTSQQDGRPRQLRIIDLSDNTSNKLTDRGATEIFSWSPDGEKIVYTQHDYSEWTYDNGVLWIIDLKTGTEHQLTFNTKK